MDLEEVKTCIRALVSSTTCSYCLNNLLNDFKNMTGLDLPLFGYLHPVEFLKTLTDTVQLYGDSCNPEIALVKSNKSAHIISLVDRQKSKRLNIKYSRFTHNQKRLIIPNKNEFVETSKDFCSNSTLYRNFKETKTSLPPLLPGPFFNTPANSKLRHISLSFNTHSDVNGTYWSKPISHLPLLNEKIDPKPLLKRNNYSNQISNSAPCQELKIQTQKYSMESPENEKTDSCYFEDVSDNETSLSIEESRSSSGQAVSTSCYFVNDGIKNKLKKIIQNYPKGLWCCELPDLFLEEFNFVLDYREFGYTSLIQMLSELPDVFRCIRPGNEDWILFDASVPPSQEEKKMTVLQLNRDTNCRVRANIQRLLFNYIENSSDSGIEIDKIQDLYQNMFGSHLDLQSLGFKDIKSLLENWEGSFLNMLRINGKIIVVPMSKLINHPTKPWEEAVPPITPENDIFADIFPKEVVGPQESLPDLDLARHVAVGQMVEVCVAEVWSPSKFYLQLNKFKGRLNRFMDEMQKFYDVHLSKYKMPDSTIQPNQVCVGLYNSEPDFPDEWHRAQIIKVINEKLVLINFVDFGTVTRVRKSQLRFMHRNFQGLPIQAFQAELSGIASPNEENKWPISTSKKFLELLRVPYLDAEIVDIDFKKPFMSVILFDSFQKPVANINKKLVLEKLARVKEPEFEELLLTENETKKETETSNLKSPKNETKAISRNASGVSMQESLNKNLPEITDEFSDIVDLGPTTLFHFKMKSLKLEDSSTSNSKRESCKTPEVYYEFEEVSDLDKNEIEQNIDEAREKKVTQENAVENKKSSESTSVLSEVRSQSPPPILKEKSSDIKFPAPGTFIRQKHSSPLSGKPKRLPPGFEHINVSPDFNRMQLLMEPEDLKKRMNILAMELLTTSASIKQVGLTDPILALKIATEMAEAYISSEFTRELPYCFNTQLANTLTNEIPQNVYEGTGSDEPVVPALPIVPSEISVSVTETTNNNSSESKPTPKVTIEEKKENKYVRNVEVGGKNLHLVVVDNQYYFYAEEIVRTFSMISNREIADRVLHIKKVHIDYKIISKKTDENVFNALKSSDLPIVKKKAKKLKIYLIPFSEVVLFLQTLGCQTKTFENEFFDLWLTGKKD